MPFFFQFSSEAGVRRHGFYKRYGSHSARLSSAVTWRPADSLAGVLFTIAERDVG